MPQINLKAIRQALKMSQADLAKLSGLGRRSIIAAEHSRRPLTEKQERRIEQAAGKEKARMLKLLKAIPD